MNRTQSEDEVIDIRSANEGGKESGANEGENERSGRLGPRRLRRVLSFLAMLGLVGAIGWWLFRYEPESLSALRTLSAASLVGLLLLQLLASTFLNAANLRALNTYAPSVGFWELHVMRTTAMVGGHVIPFLGGTSVKAVYLRHRHGMEYSTFGMIAALFAALSLMIGGILALIWMTVLLICVDGIPIAPSLIAVGSVGAGVIVLFALGRSPRLVGWISAKWSSRFDLTEMTPRLGGVIVFLGLRFLSGSLAFVLLYGSLSGQAEQGWAGGAIYLLSTVAWVVQLTPGNLGTSEWLVALIGAPWGIEIGMGLVAVLLFRLSGYVAQAIWGVVAMVLRDASRA